MDLRTRKLAKIVVNKILKVKSGENVIVAGGIESQEFIIALYKEIILAGGHTVLKPRFPRINNFFSKTQKNTK